MDVVNPQIDAYLDEVARPADALLREMEEWGRARGFPIVGPQVGQLLYVLARSVNAKRVLEPGSGYGYSALWFARAVGPDGLVVLTEGDAKNAQRARQYFVRAGLSARARFLVGNAFDVIANEPGPFDIIFCDVDKADYPRVLEVVRPRLRVGGLFVCDHMLWDGKPPEPLGAGCWTTSRMLRRTACLN
jgi:predicted O-methyltransferase YrrM